MTQDSSIKADIISLNDEKKPFFSKAMLHNGRQNIIRSLKLMIIIFILHLMGAPLLIASAMAEISKTHEAPELSAYVVIALFATAMGAAAGILCALSVFGYLYKKTDVDMHMGLPMNTSQRFVSDFISGLIVYIVPFIAAQIITFALMLAAHIGYDGKFFFSEYIGENGQTVKNVWVCNIFMDIFPFLWKAILGGILIMIMFYTVTVLAACLCGSILESVGYNILLIVLVPLISYLMVNVVTDYATDVSSERYIYKALALCGPVGGVCGLITALSNEIPSEWGLVYGLYNGSYAFWSYAQWLLLFLLVTIAIGICTYLIYRRRRAEDTGKPVVFELFYHITLAMSMLAVCYAFLIGTDEPVGSKFVPMLIITAIVYFVFHAAKNRGFGKILKGIVIYAVTVGICIGSFYLIKITEGFGIGDYVPDPSSVKSIVIGYTGFSDSDYSTFVDSITNAQLTSDESIRTVTEIHRHYVDNRNEDIYWGRGMELCYRLKSGKTVYRTVYLDDEAEKMLLTLDTSEELRRARADYAEYKLKTAKQDEYNIETVDLTSQWSDSFYQIQNGVRPLDSYVSVPYDSLPDDFTEKLSEALRTDIMNESEEDYFRSQAPEYSLYVKYTEISIKGNYTNTMEYLRSCGLDAGNISEISEEYIKEIIESPQNNAGYNFQMTDIGLTSFFSGTEFNGNIGVNWNTMYDISDDNGFIGSCSRYTLLESYHEDIRKLLEVSRTMYKSDDVRYTIFVNGVDAAIPAEYNELAERVFIRSVADYYTLFYGNTEQTDYEIGDYSYIKFIGKFCEYCGEDKITSALEYYYGKETASAIYEAMSSLEIPADAA